MKLYFAPMEGITGYVYRNAHNRWFGGIDKYFTPFIVPGKNRNFRSRDLNDVKPEHNRGVSVVPQILTNDSEDFLHTAGILKDYGYEEINLNLGCPSGTVVSKGRGAGFLADPDQLERFFDQIFEKADVKISVKTRIGVEDRAEWERLLEIYSRFPLEELIIHPRVRKDFYKNQPDPEAFRKAEERAPFPVCYNGDLFTVEKVTDFSECFPEADRVMLGRGLVADPGLARTVKGEAMLDNRTLAGFHHEILEGYRELLSGDRNVLFKMKELWTYMIHLFPDNESYRKKIRKAQSLPEYNAWVEKLLTERDIILHTGGYKSLHSETQHKTGRPGHGE